MEAAFIESGTTVDKVRQVLWIIANIAVFFSSREDEPHLKNFALNLPYATLSTILTLLLLSFFLLLIIPIFLSHMLWIRKLDMSISNN